MQNYIPILRHGRNEQKVMGTLNSSLTGSSESWADSTLIKPLIEVVEKSHINSVPSYSKKYDEVFVDLPEYLLDRENKHQSSVDGLLSKYGGDRSEFFDDIAGDDFVPVVSDRLDPIDYKNIKTKVKALKPNFDRIAVRLFIPVDRFDDKQESLITSIVDVLRPEDVILADVVDVRDIEKGIKSNLEFLTGICGENEAYVIDLFEPRDDLNYNYSLVMAKDVGTEGFGDYCLEPRFQDDIPDAAFVNIHKKVRQYKSDRHAVSEYDDPDHYVPVVEEMINRGAINPDHCRFCEELVENYREVESDPERTDLHNGFVKRARMGHYQVSLLKDEIPDLDAASDAEEFDSKGYEDIT